MSQAQVLPADHFSPSVSLIEGRPATTSLAIANHFGKRHDHVMRSIKELMDNCPKEFTAPNFGVSEYMDDTGRTLPMFTVYFDGFILLVMGYTGKKALAMKLAYIAAFNAMREQLAALPSQSPLSTSEDRKPLRALVHAWAQVAGVHHAALWPQVKAHFQLSRIDDLPAEWIPDALAFVQGKIDELGKAKALPLSNVALAAAAMSHFSLPSSEMSENDIVDDARGKRLKRVLRDLHAMQEQCGGLIDEVRICLSPKGRKFFLPEKLDNTYKTLQHLNFAATAGVYMARQALISAYHIGRGIEFC